MKGGGDDSAADATANRNKKRRRGEHGGEEEAGQGRGGAARLYQKWLEARYLDFLKVLLEWLATQEDFHRQVRASRRGSLRASSLSTQDSPAGVS